MALFVRKGGSRHAGQAALPQRNIQHMVEKRCYTVKDLQEILEISRPTVYNLLKKKEFRWIRLGGGKYRISKKSFDDWLDKKSKQQ